MSRLQLSQLVLSSLGWCTLNHPPPPQTPSAPTLKQTRPIIQKTLWSENESSITAFQRETLEKERYRHQKRFMSFLFAGLLRFSVSFIGLFHHGCGLVGQPDPQDASPVKVPLSPGMVHLPPPSACALRPLCNQSFARPDPRAQVVHTKLFIRTQDGT